MNLRLVLAAQSVALSVFVLSSGGLAQEELRTLDLGTELCVNAVAFSPGGETIAIGLLPTFEVSEKIDFDKPGQLQLWKWRGNEPPVSIQDHAGGVSCVAFSPDGGLLATGSSDRAVRLRDAASGLTHRTLEGHSGVVTSVTFSPDGHWLISGGASVEPGRGEIKVWKVATGELRATLPAGGINAVAVSPDGRKLAATLQGGAIHSLDVWGFPSLQNRRTMDTFRFAATCVAFTPDSERLVTGVFWLDETVPENKVRPGQDAGGEIRSWDLATGKPHPAVRGSLVGVNTLAFFPDSPRLATASHGDGRFVRVKLWDLTLGRELASFGPTEEWQTFRSLAISPDGKTLALGAGYVQHRGSPGIVRLWNVADFVEK